jgi:uncharacterized protein YcaQ
MVATITNEAARRIALGAQGFARERGSGTPTTRHYAGVMARLGLIQLDSVNVCARSHYMPFYARIGAYDQRHLDAWLNTRERHFEYWAHEASVMPVEQYPLWRWRMQEWQPWKSARAVMEQHPELVDRVLQQVHDRGPLTVSDLEGPKARNGPWWGHGPGKLVLEMLFGEGKLTALRNQGFTRLYDLPERTIPRAILLDERYDKHLAHRELLLRAVRHHGIGTARDLADYYRLEVSVARPLLAELAREGHIDEVAVEGWKGPVYRDPAARCPRAIRGSTLLSPFDPITWCRERAQRLFDFHYRIEIYTPPDARKYGYYVLPFMLDGELVARVDLKADRKESVLRVPSAFIEAGCDESRVGRALAAELERFASWLGLAGISLGRRGDLMRELRKQCG